jgi:hypothetical protein
VVVIHGSVNANAAVKKRRFKRCYFGFDFRGLLGRVADRGSKLNLGAEVRGL